MRLKVFCSGLQNSAGSINRGHPKTAGGLRIGYLLGASYLEVTFNQPL